MDGVQARRRHDASRVLPRWAGERLERAVGLAVHDLSETVERCAEIIEALEGDIIERHGSEEGKRIIREVLKPDRDIDMELCKRLIAD